MNKFVLVTVHVLYYLVYTFQLILYSQKKVFKCITKSEIIVIFSTQVYKYITTHLKINRNESLY